MNSAMAVAASLADWMITADPKPGAQVMVDAGENGLTFAYA